MIVPFFATVNQRARGRSCLGWCSRCSRESSTCADGRQALQLARPGPIGPASTSTSLQRRNLFGDLAMKTPPTPFQCTSVHIRHNRKISKQLPHNQTWQTSGSQRRRPCGRCVNRRLLLVLSCQNEHCFRSSPTQTLEFSVHRLALYCAGPALQPSSPEGAAQGEVRVPGEAAIPRKERHSRTRESWRTKLSFCPRDPISDFRSSHFYRCRTSWFSTQPPTAVCSFWTA